MDGRCHKNGQIADPTMRAVILYVLFSHWAFATDILYVKSSEGICLPGCGSSTNACPTIKCGLKRAKSNDTLLLTAGHYSGEGNIGISSRNYTDLSGLKFEGEGIGQTVISCLEETNGWLKTSSNFVVEVSQLSITNCQGIISLNSSLTVVDTEFSNHTAVTNGTGILSVGTRGRTKLVLTRCSFGGLVASAGSAVTVIGPVSLIATQSNFSHNGLYNGAEDSKNTPVTTSGGAVWMTGMADGFFDECFFFANAAQVNGGAVTITVEGQLDASTTLDAAIEYGPVRREVIFRKSIFQHNKVISGESCPGSTECDALGGAVYTETHGVAQFDECIFESNIVYSSPLSGGRGGAIYATRAFDTQVHDAIIDISGCIFNDNAVLTTSSSTSMCTGGAIYANYLAVRLSGTDFTGNYVTLETEEDSQDIFSVNPFLGGAVGTLHVFLTISGCNMIGNSAGMGGNGGALWLETNTIANISSTTFQKNVVTTSYGASGQGGAIASIGDVEVKIYDSYFIENQALVCTSAKTGTYPSSKRQRHDAQQCMSGSGGALYIQGGSVLVERSKFMKNVADSGGHDSGATGGALAVIDSAKSDIVFWDCQFDQNRAGGGTSGIGNLGGASNAASGGAVFGLASIVQFHRTLFMNNTVLGSPGEFSYGGAVTLRYYSQGYSLFSNCTFLINRACPRYCPDPNLQYLSVVDQGSRGGGIALIAASATVLHSSFEKNKVYSSYAKVGMGGAVFITTSGHLDASNSTFHSNTIVPHTNQKLQWVTTGIGDESDFKHLAVGSQIGATSFPDASVNITLSDECVFTPNCFTAQGLTKPTDPESPIANLIKVTSEFFVHTVQCFDIAALGAHVQFKDLSRLSNHTNVLLVAPPKVAISYSTNVNGGHDEVSPAILEIDASVPPQLSIWSWGGIVKFLTGTNSGKTHSLFIQDIKLVNSSLETDADITVNGDFVASGSTFSASQDMVSNCEVHHNSRWVNLINQSNDDNDQTLSCPIITAKNFIELDELEDYVGIIDETGADVSANNDRLRLYLELATNSISSLFNSNLRPMKLISIAFVIDNNYAEAADLGPGIVHDSTLNSPLRLKLQISSEMFELTNAWFVVAPKAAIFSFPDTLTFQMHDTESLFLMEGEFWLERYTSIQSQLSNIDRCNQEDKSDDDQIAAFTLNGTNYNLIINGTAIQTPGSEFHVEALDHVHRFIPYIYVSNTTMWEGSLNLRNAVPLGSVTLDPKSQDVSSKYEIVEFGEVVGNKTNITMVSLNTMTIKWEMEYPHDEISQMKGRAAIDSLTCEGILPYSSVLRDLQLEDQYPKDNQLLLLNCSSCKRNHDCEYCASPQGIYPETSWGCYTKGNGSCPSNQFKYTCCEQECGDNHKLLGFITFPRGKCEQKKHFWYLHACRCNTWMYKGDDCDTFTKSGFALIILFCLFPVLVIFAILALYFRRALADAEATHQEELENQEANTLADLRQRLLNTGDDDDESKLRHVGVDKRQAAKQNFLQDLTEKLVLQDVLVPFEQLTLEKHIGEGGMGVVYRAKFRSARVAVKLIKTPEFMEMDEQEMERFRAEAYLMSRLRHPNLVLIMGVTQFVAEKHKIPDSVSGIMPGFKVGDKTIGIISEYLNRGSLDSMLYGDRAHVRRNSMDGSVQSDQQFPVAGWSKDKNDPESETRTRSFSIDSMDSQTVWSYEIILSCALQAARGVLFLHSQTPPIVHRDLKCSNLVIDDKFVVKITDFGMSRLLPSHITDERAESVYSRPSSQQSGGPNSMLSDIESGDNSSTTRGSSLMDNPSQRPMRLPSSGVFSKINNVDDDEDDDQRPNSLFTRLDSVDPNADILPPTLPPIGSIEAEAPVPSPSTAGRTYVEDGGGVAMTSNIGTVAWAAPEIFAGENVASYSLACDSYSFGMILYELAERRSPFDHLNSRFDIMDLVLQGKRPEITCSLLLDEQPAYRSLMERCWAQRPDMRPTFFEIVESLEEMYAAERSANKQIEAEARRASSVSRKSTSLQNKILFNLPPTSPSLGPTSTRMSVPSVPNSDTSDEAKPNLGRFGFRLGLFPKRNGHHNDDDDQQEDLSQNLLHPRSRSSF